MKSTHQEEHHEILDVLQEAAIAMEAAKIKFHNGNKKNNALIMKPYDLIAEARVMLRQHAKATVGDDAKLEKFKKYEKLIYVFVATFVASIAKHAYDLFLMTTIIT